MTSPATTPRTTLDAARDYERCGWCVVPVPPGEKGPRTKGWPGLRLTEADLPRQFVGDVNIAILTGEPSGGLVDIDLDAPEAMALADEFLPPTGMVHGRPTKPRSHRWYLSPVRSRKYQGRDGTTLVEVRSTGLATLAPPSTHPSGEQCLWHSDSGAARANAADLENSVATLAAAALIARHWPRQGARHEAALALSGALLGHGWALDKVEHIVGAAARAAGDEEAPARIRDVSYTAKAMSAGRPVTGLPRLSDLMGKSVVAVLVNWLQLEESRASVPPRAWPDPPAVEAFHGLAGDLVHAIAPLSEADPLALLAHFLIEFGNIVGTQPYFPVEADEHHTNVFAVFVGVTSKSRKGTSQSWVRRIFRMVDATWANERIQTGLSSGEGLIYAVRDPVIKRESAPDNMNGDSCEVTVDP